jgi:glycosyltransferase involved in cell wall biosynthesis
MSPRPRVLILTTYYHPVVGGVESNARRLAVYLRAAGFDVRVLTKRVARGLADVEDVDGVTVERIGPFGERSASGKWRLVPSAIAALVRRRSTYDVVCCIDCRGIGVAAMAARTLTGRPVLLQAQTTGVMSGNLADPALEASGIAGERWFAAWLKAPARAIYHRADAFACISRIIEREMLAAGVPRRRVHYLPNAVDMSRYHPPTETERRACRRQLNLDADTIVCLFVGRLSREKGLMDLMEAWQEIQTQSGDGNRLLLVAGPDMEGHPWNVGPAAREFARAHGLEGSVRFLGSIGDVAPLIRAADVVVQPSYFEALGLSAIEALATGVPVIASAVGGLLEFMVDGENGKVCPPRNAPALAAALQTLLADSGLRAAMAGRARASVSREYDQAVVFDRFAALLRELTEARP